MDFEKYRDQYIKNIKVMSRTANGEPDACDSGAPETEDASYAQALVLENSVDALRFLYDNRKKEFEDDEELSELLIKAAEIASRGIVEPGSLFRSGKENTLKEDAEVERLWKWFTGTLFKILKISCFDEEEIAAFCEYVICVVGCFFSDGCRRIAMLISSYILMRYDMSLPVYHSREEYLEHAKPVEKYTVFEFEHMFADEHLNEFFDYYKSMCLSGERRTDNRNITLPRIDSSTCRVLAAGANGVVMAVNDEQIAKVFKSHVDIEDIRRERDIMRKALVAGVPAPISFGYAEVDGDLALVMELVPSPSITDLAREGKCDDVILKKYAETLKTLHSIHDEEKLEMFPRNGFEESVLLKADRTDRFLDEKYRGLARKAIEAVDEKEALIHGDAQPSNLMLCGKENILMIDFDTFCTGKPVLDIGGIYRTVLGYTIAVKEKENTFLKLKLDDCVYMWEGLISEYYKGESEEYVKLKTTEAEIVAYVLTLAFVTKRDYPGEIIENTKECLQGALDRYSECKK